MSRSGYTDDYDLASRNLYRANVDRAISGKRGQAFLREMAAAMDAMPVKELIADAIVSDEGRACAIGTVALARQLDVSDLDVHDQDEVAKRFRIARCLAAEIAFENDDDFATHRNETPAERWTRMRKWVEDNLRRHDAAD